MLLGITKGISNDNKFASKGLQYNIMYETKKTKEPEHWYIPLEGTELKLFFSQEMSFCTSY